MPMPASLLLLCASSEGGKYTDLCGHAKAIQGHDPEIGGGWEGAALLCQTQEETYMPHGWAPEWV